MIYLVGGPPHQDMFDLKPEAPERLLVRGGRLQPTFPAWKSAKPFRVLAGNGGQVDDHSLARWQSGGS